MGPPPRHVGRGVSSPHVAPAMHGTLCMEAPRSNLRRVPMSTALRTRVVIPRVGEALCATLFRFVYPL